MRWNVRVVSKRKIWFVVSGVMFAVALVSMLFQGLNYGIDFTGGIIMDLRFDKATTSGEVRQVLAGHGLDEAVIREAGEGGREYLITIRDIPEDKRKALMDDLTQKLGKFEQLSLDKVSPVVGQELRKAALLGVFLATLGMLVYITFRFEWKFGVAAIVALLHDVFLTIGFFSLFRLTVDTSFVAAVLTVFGYSINDTIVVFDRIRENLAKRRREDVEELVDRSINQVMTRSINTVFTTLLAITAVFLFGGRTVHDLALALIVGIAFGAYSSIFLASPLYVAIVERFDRKAAATRA